MKYIVIDCVRNGAGDEFTTECATLTEDYTAYVIRSWILDHHCVEFNGDNATYHIHIDGDGYLKADASEAVETITETVDASEWANDDSPERFYDEFETMDNADFREMVKSLAAKADEAMKYKKRWFAVQETSEDWWDHGSYDYNEAIEMLKEQGHGLIAVIEQDNCIDEIPYEDAFDE